MRRFEGDDYPGIRVCLKANYPPISVLAYNLETVLAEKIETVLSRSIANTRPRDFYDIHILYALRGEECNPATLKQALERTTEKRGSHRIMEHYDEIIDEIQESSQLQNFWQKYQKNYEYARDISFNDACKSIREIMECMMG